MVGATIELCNDLRATLLPTPAKSHYTYNMRDLSKMFQVGWRRRGWLVRMPMMILHRCMDQWSSQCFACQEAKLTDSGGC
jgi:hypothetical protein